MLGVCSNATNECLVEAHFTLAYFTSQNYRALCLPAHYSSNNGLDHNLQFSHLADALIQSDLQQVHST